MWRCVWTYEAEDLIVREMYVLPAFNWHDLENLDSLENVNL